MLSLVTGGEPACKRMCVFDFCFWDFFGFYGTLFEQRKIKTVRGIWCGTKWKWSFLLMLFPAKIYLCHQLHHAEFDDNGLKKLKNNVIYFSNTISPPLPPLLPACHRLQFRCIVCGELPKTVDVVRVTKLSFMSVRRRSYNFTFHHWRNADAITLYPFISTDQGILNIPSETPWFNSSSDRYSSFSKRLERFGFTFCPRSKETPFRHMNFATLIVSCRRQQTSRPLIFWALLRKKTKKCTIFCRQFTYPPNTVPTYFSPMQMLFVPAALHSSMLRMRNFTTVTC